MMEKHSYEKLVDIVTTAAEPIDETEKHYSTLLNKIGDARFVLIGEETHGTQEFYQTRIEITKQLISKKGFMAIAIEGDWPNAYHIHRYIQGIGNKDLSEKALSGFTRFPTWMWRNQTLPPFLRWLRTHNDNLSPFDKKIGFYGLDLYSLYASMQAVIDYLSKVDAEAAERARQRYACFEHAKLDPQMYGYLASQHVRQSCVKEAVEQLLEMQYHAIHYIQEDALAEDDFFYAMQNARVVKNAENYYRSLFEGHETSWNIRDRHMIETLNILIDHLEKRFNKPAKIVVWAHNSHVGDARATEMGQQGEVNIGQLAREHHNGDVYLIGFSTYQGSVTAASDWDGPAEQKQVNPGLASSYEDLFHQVKYKNFLLDLHRNKELEHFLHIPRLQRAIGVIYRPETERASHYFFTRLPYQFDSIIHLDQTTAVQPLAF